MAESDCLNLKALQSGIGKNFPVAHERAQQARALAKAARMHPFGLGLPL